MSGSFSLYLHPLVTFIILDSNDFLMSHKHYYRHILVSGSIYAIKSYLSTSKESATALLDADSIFVTPQACFKNDTT